MFSFTYKYRTCRKLRGGISSAAGRNYTGRLSLLRRAGPKVKWSYTYINHFREANSFYFVLRFDFSSFHNRYLALVYDFYRGLSYYNPVEGMRVFQTIFDNNKDRYGFGSVMSSNYFSSGKIISNVSSVKFQFSKFGRSPGSKILVLSINSKTGRTLCKLPSGNTQLFSKLSKGLLGSVMVNHEGELKSWNKAGFWVYRGRRPSVRGVAKNPVDHPHGGGEGKKSPLSSPRSPWGWITKNLSYKDRINFW